MILVYECRTVKLYVTFTITIVEGILILTPKVPETNPSVTVSGAGEFSDSGHQSLNQDLIRT